MSRLRIAALLISAALLLLLVPSLGAPAKVNLLTAHFDRDYVFLGGSLKVGAYSLPFFGYVSNSTRKLYYVDAPGFVTGSYATNGSGVFVGTVFLEGAPSILVAEVEPRGEPRVYALRSAVPLYGVDVVSLGNGTLFVAGYVYAEATTRSSDVVVVRLSKGTPVRVVVFGSPSFDDHPRRILYAGGYLVVVGETWAYNVSQGDVFVARLTPQLELKDDTVVGGAGIDTPEDALPLDDGSLLLVGSTVGGDGTHDGFVARVSEVGGLLYLSSITGYGEEYAVAVTRVGGAYIVVAYGGFEEDTSGALILNYTLRGAWDLAFQGAYLVKASNSSVLPVKAPWGAREAVFKTDGEVFEVFSGREVCLSNNCSLREVVLAEYGKQVSAMLSPIYGWRTLHGVMKARATPEVEALALDYRGALLNASTSSLEVFIQPYARRFDPVKETIKFLERNIPILLFLPMVAAAVIVTLQIKRR